MNYQKDAARHGFDWPDMAGVWDKLHEEIGELQEAAATDDQAHIRHEVGDLIFAVVNLARKLDVEPDMALRQANRRFRDRFHLVEADFEGRGVPLREATLDEMEASWQTAKSTLDDATAG